MNSFRKIKNIFNFVWDNHHSSFYRSKYKKVGINDTNDIKTYQDFQNLPFLTRQEIVESDPYDRIFLPWEKIEKATVSGGTSGGKYPLLIFKDKTKKEPGLTYHKEMLEKKVKTLLMLYPALRAQIMYEATGTYLNHKIMRFVGDSNNLPLSAKIAARLKVEALQTTATLLYFFTDYLKKEYDLNNIKVIYIGGEYTSQAKLNYFKKQYKNAFFKFSYGSSEAEIMAERCKYLAKRQQNLFHPLTTFHFENTEEDELVVTSLYKTAFPLIRYKTGDIGKIRHKKCACGKNTTLELLGRKQFDVFKIHGGFIYAEKIGNILQTFDNIIDPFNWQVHIYEEENKGKIIPKLVFHFLPKVKDPRSKKIVLSKVISDSLYLSATKTLGDLINDNVFMPVEIEFVESLGIYAKQKHIILH